MKQDQVFKVVDLIISQSNDLWPISTALLVAAGLTTVRLVAAASVDRRAVTWLVASMILNVGAMFTGYMVKGALIVQLSKLQPDSALDLSGWSAWASLLQGGFLFLSVVVLIIAFVLHRAAIASAASKVWGNQ